MKFNQDYTQYWISAVDKSIDGTVIAGVEEAKKIFKILDLGRKARILDLGCSYGRMFDAVKELSDDVYATDPDASALDLARNRPYSDTKIGSAEFTGYDDAHFDFVFCWAVFDVVDHKKGLREINRILSINGQVLLTGKCSNYCITDELGFKAEKNAYLKGFPNRFTNLKYLSDNIKVFGFVIDRIIIFSRRGDFGLLKYSEIILGNNCDISCYEYLLLCRKISDPVEFVEPNLAIDLIHSDTAVKISKSNGYNRVIDYFRYLGLS